MIMRSYFIDSITTYRKYCKAGKGLELERLLNNFYCALLPNNSFVRFVSLLQCAVSDLNRKYPRTKPFEVEVDSDSEHIYIRPVGVRSFESDYVAIISAKVVLFSPDPDIVSQIFNDFDKIICQKGETSYE